MQQTYRIIEHLERDIDKAEALFQWGMDMIPHSRPIGSDVVTCSVSEVLSQRTGLCFAKSPLLAVVLRCARIPAEFCYQALQRNTPYTGLALHGLSGLYFGSPYKWIRVDACENSGSIDAQFSVSEERLAFPIDGERGEFIYGTIFTDPVPSVVDLLQRYSSVCQMWSHLPKP